MGNLFSLENIIFGFLLTSVAGLSTGIGSLIAFLIKVPKVRYLTFGLGFSAGVMIYVSFAELLPAGIEDWGEIEAIIAFFIGILAIFLIDMLIPEIENPHHPIIKENLNSNNEITNNHQNDRNQNEREKENNNILLKSGLMTALAIAIHNFPEGMATLSTSLGDLRLGLAIAIAIAIHNIPEGISVSIPIYYATNDKNKAFVWSFLSGITEPVGALFGFLILQTFLTPQIVGGLLAFISGIMVYISLDEILPTAHHYGHGHGVIIGTVLGMAVMAISLLLL